MFAESNVHGWTGQGTVAKSLPRVLHERITFTKTSSSETCLQDGSVCAGGGYTCCCCRG